MSAVVTVLHVIVCVFLIAVVLLQRGKGAQIGAVFGGGAGATLFGSRGAGNFLTKLTAGAATVFMITSLSLSYFGITGASERLFEDGGVQQEAPEAGSLFEEVGTVPADPAVEAPAADVEADAAETPPASAPDGAPASPETPAPDAG
jgi:preprotein translocase subunit SecG